MEVQYEHSLVVDSMLAAIKRLEKTENPVRFVLQSGDAVVDGRDPRQWNASFVDLINRLTVEGGVPYFLAPGNHDVTGASALDSPEREKGLRNYLAAVAQLIPPDGAARRLAGYPTYAFGYGNTFLVALDSNIAGDDEQFEWVRAQLEGLDRGRYKNVVASSTNAFSSGPHAGARVERPAGDALALHAALPRRTASAPSSPGTDTSSSMGRALRGRRGRRQRLDMVITGGGGAPLYPHFGEPLVADYLKANEAGKVQLEHLARPGPEPGNNPYHYVIVRVDGERLRMEVVGVDWGRGFRPYRSNSAVLEDEPESQR